MKMRKYLLLSISAAAIALATAVPLSAGAATPASFTLTAGALGIVPPPIACRSVPKWHRPTKPRFREHLAS